MKLSKGKRLKPVLLLGNQLLLWVVHFSSGRSTSIWFGVKSRLNVAFRGVIAFCAALDWIEDCSTFGGPVAFESIGADSVLTVLNV